MSGSLRLVESEKPIGEIDLCESQVFDIAEPKSGIEAEQERPAYNRILVGVMRHRKLLDFLHRKNIFLDLLTIDCDNYAITRIPQEYVIFRSFLEHFLESLEQSVRLFSCKPRLEILGKLPDHLL